MAINPLLKKLTESNTTTPARATQWTEQLSVSIAVKLDASGNGQIAIGPEVAREYWEPTQINVSCFSNVNESVCATFMGNGLTAVLPLGTTAQGSSGDSNAIGGIILDNGRTIIAQWTGADPNTRATLSVYGTRKRYGQV